MQIISRVLDWVNPDRVVSRAKDEQQELFRQHIKRICNLAGSNERIAQAFFELVERQTWSMNHLCNAVKLLPITRYEKVTRLLLSMFIEADIEAPL